MISEFNHLYAVDYEISSVVKDIRAIEVTLDSKGVLIKMTQDGRIN